MIDEVRSLDRRDSIKPLISSTRFQGNATLLPPIASKTAEHWAAVFNCAAI